MAAVTSRPSRTTRPDVTGSEPGDELGELGLSVAGHTGDADDLARVDVEVDAPDAGPASAARAQERTPALDRSPARALPSELAPDHQARELGRVDVSPTGARARHVAVAQDRDALRDAHHLVELVADEHGRLASVAELADDAEQAVGLLGREHRGGLVEDEQLRAAVERPQDLDPLEVADRELVDALARVDRERSTARRAR